MIEKFFKTEQDAVILDYISISEMTNEEFTDKVEQFCHFGEIGEIKFAEAGKMQFIYFEKEQWYCFSHDKFTRQIWFGKMASGVNYPPELIIGYQILPAEDISSKGKTTFKFYKNRF